MAEILRATLFALGYPKGKTVEDENFSFSLEARYLSNLIKKFQEIFPPFKSLSINQIENILQGWGFVPNLNLGREGKIQNYSALGLSREEVEKILREIAVVDSYY